MKKFIKIFLLSSLSFGISWTAVMALLRATQGYDLTLRGFLIIAATAGFTFGFIATISLMIMEHLSMMKFKNKKEASKIRVKREIIVSLNYDDAVDKVKEVLSLMEAKIIKEDKETGIIAKTGVSWKSFGEILTVNFERISDNQTQVEILSRPKIRATMIDYGKNFENVEGFCNKMIR